MEPRWVGLFAGLALVSFLNLAYQAKVINGEVLEDGDVRDRSRRSTLEAARTFLARYNEEARVKYNAATIAAWEYNTNLTEENRAKSNEVKSVTSEFENAAAKSAREFNASYTDWPTDVKRQLRYIGMDGVSALDNETVAEYFDIISMMRSNYGNARVCRPDNETDCLRFDPDIIEIMANSTDWDELVWAWKGFRDTVGVANKPLYLRYIEIANEAARFHGYNDLGEYWRSTYEDYDVKTAVYKMYDAILPLYKQLHAYVRRKLHGVYGDKIDLKGPMPGNVLGDIWGRFWWEIYDLVVPYPDEPNVDVTDAMIEQGYNVTKMYQLADEFFTSMGLMAVNDQFWERSMLTRPEDGREVVCHPSAWDFQDGQDFRVKMCTKINMADFMVVHHEMGHIQYDMQYRDLPQVFRSGANRAFHEAVGEVMALSVSTPKHLKVVGLLDPDVETTHETDINFLLKTSLSTIGTLPFSLALEQWRWDAFSGDINAENETSARWWKLKHDIVGVKPPVTRTEEDFDPGAMFHIVISYSFIRYYIRTIIQFQFYKALCDEAGHTGPLHRCDFYNSTAAGTKLANMLSMGKSRPWRDAMEAITGQREMSADAILEYFAPLMTWLEKENKKNGEKIGWTPDKSGGRATQTVLLPVVVAMTVVSSFLGSMLSHGVI